MFTTKQSSSSSVYVNNNGKEFIDKRNMNVFRDNNGAEIFGDINDFPFYRKMNNKEFKNIIKQSKSNSINLLDKLEGLLLEKPKTKKRLSKTPKKQKAKKNKTVKNKKNKRKTKKNKKGGRRRTEKATKFK